MRPMGVWDRLKDKKVRAIIISSRSPTLDAKAMMEKRGIASVHLLAQPPGGGEFRPSAPIHCLSSLWWRLTQGPDACACLVARFGGHQGGMSDRPSSCYPARCKR